MPRRTLGTTPGYWAQICSCRRRLLVPITLPGGSAGPTAPLPAALSRPPPIRSSSPPPNSPSAASRVTSTSAASSRSSTAPMQSLSGSSIGISLALCTAISTAPDSSASSSSAVNTPLPPKLARDRSKIRSPFVVTGTSSISSSGNRARSASRTSSVWMMARRLFLVPIRSFILPP